MRLIHKPDCFVNFRIKVGGDGKCVRLDRDNQSIQTFKVHE